MKKLLIILLLSPLAFADWITHTVDDPIDGSWKYIYKISEDSTKTMRVRKDEGKWELALFPNDSYICAPNDYINVIFKIDSNSIFQNRFRVATDNTWIYLDEGYEYSYFPEKDDAFGKKLLSKDKFWLGTSKQYMDFNSFFNELFKADKLFMRMTDSCGTRTDMLFVLDNFENALKQL